MNKTYIIACYCSTCNEYFEHIGRGAYERCSCGTQLVGKSVEKYGTDDPRCKEEVTNICYGENPRYSMTLGVTETQIKQAMKLHPGTDWKRFGKSFRPLIRNRGHKLQMMREAGYDEFDTKQFKGRQM
jgi:hypothetical protein